MEGTVTPLKLLAAKHVVVESSVTLISGRLRAQIAPLDGLQMEKKTSPARLAQEDLTRINKGQLHA